MAVPLLLLLVLSEGSTFRFERATTPARDLSMLRVRWVGFGWGRVQSEWLTCRACMYSGRSLLNMVSAPSARCLFHMSDIQSTSSIEELYEGWT